MNNCSPCAHVAFQVQQGYYFLMFPFAESDCEANKVSINNCAARNNHSFWVMALAYSGLIVHWCCGK